MMTRARFQSKPTNATSTTIALKNLSVNLFRNEIDKFYVKVGSEPAYYTATATTTTTAATAAAAVDSGDVDVVGTAAPTTTLHISSGPIIETKNIQGEYLLFFFAITFHVYHHQFI